MRMRSTSAPEMRAGVITANIPWKSMNAMCGMVAESDVSGSAADAREAEPVRPAQQRVEGARREREAVADHCPEHADHRHADDGEDHGVDDVLRADQAAVEEGEAGRHEHDERGAHEHEGGVARIDWIHACSSREGGVPLPRAGRVPDRRAGRSRGFRSATTPAARRARSGLPDDRCRGGALGLLGRRLRGLLLGRLGALGLGGRLRLGGGLLRRGLLLDHLLRLRGRRRGRSDVRVVVAGREQPGGRPGRRGRRPG